MKKVVVVNLHEIIEYLRVKKIEFNSVVIERLEYYKKEAVTALNESLANKIWCYEQIYTIQRMYVEVYNNLKRGKYYTAWKDIEQIDIMLSFLRKNYDYSNPNDEFHLIFIENRIREYEILFPYEYFASREAIIKKVKCSICGKTNTIRNHCEHKAGNLYMGEMCVQIIEDFKGIGIAIVKNPFDKYGVLFPQQLEYNYFMLETLMPKLRTPYEHWQVKIIKENAPEYDNVGRNEQCPCGSGKKFKKCCLETEDQYINHYRISLLDNPDVEPRHIIVGNTWK